MRRMELVVGFCYMEEHPCNQDNQSNRHQWFLKFELTTESDQLNFTLNSDGGWVKSDAFNCWFFTENIDQIILDIVLGDLVFDG